MTQGAQHEAQQSFFEIQNIMIFNNLVFEIMKKQLGFSSNSPHGCTQNASKTHKKTCLRSDKWSLFLKLPLSKKYQNVLFFKGFQPPQKSTWGVQGAQNDAKKTSVLVQHIMIFN